MAAMRALRQVHDGRNDSAATGARLAPLEPLAHGQRRSNFSNLPEARRAGRRETGITERIAGGVDEKDEKTPNNLRCSHTAPRRPSVYPHSSGGAGRPTQYGQRLSRSVIGSPGGSMIA